jgi:hypothetical protein
MLAKGDDSEGFKRTLLESARSWYVKSEPELAQLFGQGYLNGYIVESGIHTLMVIEKGRTSTCLTFLGRPLALYPAISAGWCHDGEFYRFEKGSERGAVPMDE